VYEKGGKCVKMGENECVYERDVRDDPNGQD